MAAKKKTGQPPLTWTRSIVTTEGTPVIMAGPEVYRKRTGDEGDGPAEYVEVSAFGDDSVIFLDTEGGGAVDVGYNDTETVVVVASSDFVDEPKKFAKLVNAIETAKYPEYFVGELELAEGLIIADGASSGVALPGTLPTKPGSLGEQYYLPRARGRYTVVEGHVEGDGEARWCRLTPHGTKTYRRRPPERRLDPVQSALARISFENAIAEARSLEVALELVELGRADLAIEVCAKASVARRALASWTRVVALAAQQNRAAQEEAVVLAESWLTPATSADATNQALPRNQLLRAIDAAIAIGDDARLAAVRAKVVASPEPDAFVPDTGDFF